MGFRASLERAMGRLNGSIARVGDLVADKIGAGVGLLAKSLHRPVNLLLHGRQYNIVLAVSRRRDGE